ncbi:OmpA family protein [Qipengyuania sp.]|uniref:OmpA family protein n=1 Tax=Qipengyuania sp. TaxID=2004515 RepID=UPI0035C7ACDA
MRNAIIPSMLLALAACNNSNEGAEAEPSPEPTPNTQEPPQASIMRSDMAVPTEAPAPIEPLDIVIGFPEGGAELSAEGEAKLARLVDSVQVGEGGPIELAAHSDSAGTDSANLRASRERGEAVRDWLVDKGIDPERISLVSFGEQNPAKPNALPDGTPDEAGRAANRRVEIHVPVRIEPTGEARKPTLAEEIVERTSEFSGSRRASPTPGPTEGN